jgi:rhomboid protease GluP
MDTNTPQNEEQPERISDDMIVPARPKDNRIPFEKGMSYFPLLIALIIVVNFAVFLWEIATGALLSHDSVLAAGALYPEKVLAGEWWRLITASFLHGGLDHIISNTIFMYFLGMATEHAFGLVRTAVIYLAAAVSGSLLSLVAQPGPSIGASDAVFGLMGALIVILYKGRSSYYLRNRGIGTFVAALAALVLFLGFSDPYIDNWAHLGGLLGGAAMALVLRPAPAGETEPVTVSTKTLTTGTVALLCFYLLFRSGYLAAVEATVCLGLGNRPAAFAAASEAIDRNPANAYAYFLRGTAYLADKDYKAALTDLNRYLAHRPGDDRAVFLVGTLYHEQEEYDKAVKYYSQALTISPGNLNYLNSRGYAYILVGDYPTARADFAAIMKLDAKYAPAYGNLGIIHALEGDYPKAVELLQKARSLDSGQDALKNLISGLENEQQGKRAEAAASYTAFVKSVAKDRTSWLAEIRFAEDRVRVLADGK